MIPFEIFLQDLLTQLHTMIKLNFPQIFSHVMAGFTGFDKDEPILAWILVLAGYDFNLITTMQFGFERNNLAIHLGPNAVHTHIGMHSEG